MKTENQKLLASQSTKKSLWMSEPIGKKIKPKERVTVKENHKQEERARRKENQMT